MSGVSEQANGRASGPVLTSLFLFVPDHSAAAGSRIAQPYAEDPPYSHPRPHLHHLAADHSQQREDLGPVASAGYNAGGFTALPPIQQQQPPNGTPASSQATPQQPTNAHMHQSSQDVNPSMQPMSAHIQQPQQVNPLMQQPPQPPPTLQQPPQPPPTLQQPPLRSIRRERPAIKPKPQGITISAPPNDAYVTKL